MWANHPRLQPAAGYLWVLELEDKWRTRYHMSKYLKVINQANRLLNKIYSIFLFDNDTFQNEKPYSTVAFLGSLGFGTAMWSPGGRRGNHSVPITALPCVYPSSVHAPYKQPPLNLSLGPRGGSHQGCGPPIEEGLRGETYVALEVVWVQPGRDFWVPWVPRVWSNGGALM